MTDLTWVRGGAIALGLAAIRRQNDFDAAVDAMVLARSELERVTFEALPKPEFVKAARDLDEARAKAGAANGISHHAEMLSRIMSDFAVRAMAGDEDEVAIARVANHVRALVGEALVVSALERVPPGDMKAILAERAA